MAIDRELLESGVLPDCKIAGFRSPNTGGSEGAKSREYLPEALEGAVKLCEGAWSYSDHADDDIAASYAPPGVKTKSAARPWDEKFGRFRNVRFVEGEGLRGDFHFNRMHHKADQFIGWVLMDPEGVGFSLNASGQTIIRDGVQYIVEITNVKSIDLVSHPATTKGLLESVMDLNQNMALPEIGGEGYVTAIGTLIQQILMDASLDAGGKKEKVLQALKLMDPPGVEEEPAAEETPVEEAEEAEDKPVEESEDDEDEKEKKLKESIEDAAKALDDKVKAVEERFQGLLVKLTEAIEAGESKLKLLVESRIEDPKSKPRESNPKALSVDILMKALEQGK